MRLLGVDLGSKRIGLAVGETEPPVATPRGNLKALGALTADAEQVSGFARDESVDAIVVGVPLNPEGDPRMERICRRFAAELRSLGWTVHEVDEAWTSSVAAQRLSALGARAARRDAALDSSSAAAILERFFDEREKA